MNQENSTLNINKLNNIKNIINTMDITHHIEIGKILKKNNIFLNENNNGIFVNLNTINESIIKEIEEYIYFINKQSEIIKLDENKKIDIENTYFKNT